MPPPLATLICVRLYNVHVMQVLHVNTYVFI